jgi:integrase
MRSLQPEEKTRLAVSVAVSRKGKPYTVSYYGDPVWDFWAEIGQKNLWGAQMRICWVVSFPDGSRLTDPQHARLLESAKDFILSLKREPVEGRKRPKAVTIIRKFSDLVPLLRFMVGGCISRFEDLAGRTMDYVAYARIDQRHRGEVTPASHARRLMILEDLYLQRDKLNEALGEHPWPHESACGLAGVSLKSSKKRVKTEVIPDRIVKQLGSIALDYIENKADYLLGAREATEKARKDTLGRSSNLAERTARTYEDSAARRVAHQMGFNGLIGLNHELTYLRTACYIVIDLFSGIRDSEISDLRVGCVGETVDKGGADLRWIKGKVYKGEERPHAWIVPPPVITAIRVLERLTDPLREKMKAEAREITGQLGRGWLPAKGRRVLERRLSEIETQAGNLLLTVDMSRGKRISVLNNRLTNVHLKDFCKSFQVLGDDGKPYPLHAHQFRRTFAHYIASTKFFDLNYLSEHFCHWCVDCTTAYTDGATDIYQIDSDLLNEIEEKGRTIQQEILEKELFEERPLAAGRWLLDLRPKVMTAKNRKELVQKLSDNIRIVGTGHSYCVSDTQSPCCRGECFFKKGMCKDCRTSIITLDHLPAWKGIAAQQEEIIACQDLGDDCKQEARKLLNHAEEVVSLLEGGGR